MLILLLPMLLPRQSAQQPSCLQYYRSAVTDFPISSVWKKISIVFSIPPSVRFFSLILSHVSFIIAIYYLHCRYLLSASSSFSKSLVYSQFVQTVCTNSKSYSLIFADFFHYNMPFLQKQSIKRLQCSPNPHPKSNTLFIFLYLAT